MKVAIAISGASGANLGLKAFHAIPEHYEKYLIVSDNARIVLEKENHTSFDDTMIWAGPASGSFGLDTLMVIPCSVNTLAKIAVGIADTLTTRAATVQLKERRQLLIAPREIPFHSIALEHMLSLDKRGVIIAPPVLAYYANITSLESMENFIIGRWFDLVGIEHNLFERWKG